MPNEVVELLEFLGSGKLWMYFGLMVVVFYGLMALVTWSFRRPLKFMAIPSIVAGVILVATRFLIGFIKINSLVDNLLPSLLQPLMTIGLVCIVMGVVMLVLNRVLKNVLKKGKSDRGREEKVTEEVREVSSGEESSDMGEDRLDVEEVSDNNIDETESVITDDLM